MLVAAGGESSAVAMAPGSLLDRIGLILLGRDAECGAAASVIRQG